MNSEEISTFLIILSYIREMISSICIEQDGFFSLLENWINVNNTRLTYNEQ